MWGFAPVQDRHAAPAIVRALGDLAAVGGRGGGDRRARRRLAGRPAVLLRRDPVPHGRAARRAGDRLGRPPHRPHAARRRRRRRAARRRRTPRRRPWASTARGLAPSRRAPRARLREHGAGAARARARAAARDASRARPPMHLERERARLHQQLREMRAGSRRRLAERARGDRTRGRWCSSARPPPRCSTAASAARASSQQLALALAGHDPQRTLERGYALVRSRDGRAARERRRGAGGGRAARCASPTASSAPGWTSGERGARPPASSRRAPSRRATRPRRRASRRSSAAWTPARRASARRSSWCSEGKALIEYCAARARGGRRCARGAAPGRARRPPGRRGARDEHLGAARASCRWRSRPTRSSRCRRASRATSSARRTVIRLHGAGRGGPRRGRHLRRRRPRDPAGRGAGAAARRAASRSPPSASTWRSSTCSPSRPSARCRRATARGRTSRRRSTSRCARRARRCTRRSAARPQPVRFVVSLRLGEPPTLEPVSRRLALYPGLRFKLDPTSSWDEPLIAELRRHRRGRLGRLQGLLLGLDRRPAGRPGALPARRRGVPARRGSRIPR